MKLKLDENLPESLVATLEALGPDVDNVRVEGLAGRTDPDVWQAAQNAERLLVTQDLGFLGYPEVFSRHTPRFDVSAPAVARTAGPGCAHCGRIPRRGG